MNVLQHTRNELNLCLKQNRPDRSYRDTLLIAKQFLLLFFFYFKPILFVPRLSEIKGRKTCRDFPIFRISITGGKSHCAGDHSLNVSQEKVIRKKKFPGACDPSKTVRQSSNKFPPSFIFFLKGPF